MSNVNGDQLELTCRAFWRDRSQFDSETVPRLVEMLQCMTVPSRATVLLPTAIGQSACQA
jgi:hypothetical protein